MFNPKSHIESYLFPALFALGVLVGTFIYFTLPFEVSVPLTALMSIFLLTGLYFLRSFYGFFLIFYALFAICLGLTNAAWQVQDRQPHFLEKKYEDQRLWVVGQVGKSASYNGRDKVTLENVNIYGVDKNKTPKKVRISSSVGRLSVFNVGDWVAVEAKLRAPGHPRHKGDYNFRMRAWMDEIGATGYVMGQVYKTSWPVDYKNSTYKIQHIRNTLTEKIVNVDDVPPERAVMAALITGKKTYISAEIYNAYRSSGLAHLLAISGLHLGLIGGFFFFSVRRLFGLSERITLRYNTKIPAALIAIVACLAYTALAGGTLPTLRAFIMATFIFIGFIVGRLHNTLRIFMMTLTLVLLLWPESLLTASFQMSFAAVFALTLWNELKENNMHSHLKIVRGMTYTKGVFLTSVVAGLATMPIAAWILVKFILQVLLLMYWPYL
ncbi:MAG: competence protein ComEC [Alphaproteobacteria bacterium]|jgi:competence protein ComEC